MNSSLYDLLHAWFGVADWCAYDLMKSGHEGLVLRRLASCPRAGATIARMTLTSSLYQQRKVGASLVGWLEQPDQLLLHEMFERERSRDSVLPVDDIRRLESQSVVEDIVFSAARWARREDTRPPALDFLSSFVRRTISGEYWNTAPYALVTLCRHQPEASAPLLAAFGEYATGSPPAHPSNPTLQQEREFAQQLAAGNTATLEVIETILVEKEEACQADVDEGSEATLQELQRAAEDFEGAA